MPRVVIQYPDTSDPNPADVSVHWSKESSHVQLSITRYPFGVVDSGAIASDGRPVLEGRPDYDAQKVAAADAGTGPDNPYARERLADREDPSPHATSQTLYSDPLTRHQINELIRVLRRARDGAFGADA